MCPGLECITDSAFVGLNCTILLWLDLRTDICCSEDSQQQDLHHW
jgi:hypothetical protein